MTVLSVYLDLMDRQREDTYSALANLSADQLWHCPAPKEWSIGEILDHNNLLYLTFLPMVRGMWSTLKWYGELQRKRPYPTEIDNVYLRKGFPMWVGFMWAPRHNPRKPVSLQTLYNETKAIHDQVRSFYTDKDEDVLGNLYLYDPVFGWCNLIITLRIGIYHDKLHINDILKLATHYDHSHH